MSKFNIIVLTREYPTSTAGNKRIHHLIENLDKQEVSVKVLSLRSIQKFENEKGFYEGIEYCRIGSYVNFKIVDIFKIIKYYMCGIYLIYKWKKNKNINIIYCYSGLEIENFLFVVFAKFIRFKIIFDIVEDYHVFSSPDKFISNIKTWSRKRLDTFSVFLSNAIIVISRHLQRKFENYKAKNITLIPITAKINPISEHRISFNKPFLIVYAGTFGMKDGVDFIIDGFIEYNKTYNDSVLYLIGTGVGQEKYFEKYKNVDNIIFTGFIPDDEFYRILQKADALLMCRTKIAFANAGFPFKLGEYLATGNPVIASKVSDIELFLTNDDAFLIEAENKSEFIEALKLIKSDPINAFRIGNNGYKVCLKNFSVTENSLKLMELIRNI